MFPSDTDCDLKTFVVVLPFLILFLSIRVYSFAIYLIVPFPTFFSSWTIKVE